MLYSLLDITEKIDKMLRLGSKTYLLAQTGMLYYRIGLRKCWQPSYCRRVVCADRALCLARNLSSLEPSLDTRALRLASPASATRPGVWLEATTWTLAVLVTLVILDNIHN